MMIELNQIYQGDCLSVLKSWPDAFIDCIITSPPYWGLRDYGVDGQLGLETTFQEYIAKLIAIFNEVKRVLKPTGSVWVNLGDSYSGSGGAGGDYNEGGLREGQPKFKQGNAAAPAKSLCCIPDRFKIAMVDSGWVCRNEIIWYKRNCMPSSVSDRFTVDFEKVFFFTKQGKYWFEQQFEDLSYQDRRGDQRIAYNGKLSENREGFNIQPVDYFGQKPQGRNMRCVWDVTTHGFKEAHFATFPEKLIEPMVKAGCPLNGIVCDIFTGSGTTAVVAKKLGRRWLGVELNPTYIEMANKRIANTTVQSQMFTGSQPEREGDENHK